MTDYKSLYLRLFGTIADAIERMEEQNYGLAKETLVQALQNAEAQYLNETALALRCRSRAKKQAP